ncbi:aromatic ring-hydroxylating oxygenase subunit alpha [Sphingomonas jatrophae]|uniref:Phenylpropionate dioxygenase, large terminal subunit n=1 Tax=Sphingomonas jatrophae TaxID=1166337 RepID=A0A1I6M4A5_9SPHN|nr:SRPBCC family protein [Sphingomonas jatrophae]SFS10493.1 Phenylpropionate dioxygenase, large terminal subunit [Sphingomonas jatrophae]
MASVADRPGTSPEMEAARRESHYALRRRTLDRMRSRSTDLDAAPMRIDPAVYTSADYAERERRAIFHGMPIVAGLTRDIPEPGDMMLFDVLGPSILLVRSKAGTVNAFLNMCPHRGAKVVTDCSRRTRMTCRFHAWTFDLEGKLIGQPGKEGFEGVDKAELGLLPVPVAERYGLIFVRLTPRGEPIDVDAHLGDFAGEIAHLELGKADPIRRSEIPCEANWKYALDTYGESYHFASLHPETIGQLAYSNIMIYDNYGLHARLAFPRAEFMDYQERDEAEWPHTDYGGLYMLFPNMIINVNSIPGVGQFYGISRVFPGETVDRSRTLLSTYQPAHSGAEVDVAKWAEMHDFIQRVVTEEDYSVSRDGQDNLRWAPEGFATVLGRNEIALQHWHRNLNAIMQGRN